MTFPSSFHPAGRRLRCAIRWSGGVLALALTALLGAQTAAPPPVTNSAGTPKREEAVTMEVFTVTGSNIRRFDEERMLPVTVYAMDDLDLRGVSTAAELFETLSIGGPIALDEGNTLGADARGDNATVNLRGIGSGNTLVLLNGRRLPPNPTSMAENGVPSLSVNVNNLPRAALDRVEILRDGASAIYGTDAAAGVLNSITRSRFDGLAIRTRGMMTQHGGANELSFEITEGRNFNGGKSNLLVSLEVLHRDQLQARDRRFSRTPDVRAVRDVPAPWDGLPVTGAGGTVIPVSSAIGSIALDNRASSSSSPYGNFIRGSFDPSGAFVGARPTGNRGIVTTSGSNNATMSTAGVWYLIPLADSTTGFRQTLPSHNVDDPTKGWFPELNDWRVILPRTDRLSFTADLRHRLGERLEAFGEILAYKAYSLTGREPNTFNAADDHNIYVSANNPFNPFGARYYNVSGTPNADGTPRIAAEPASVLIAPSTGVRPRDLKPREIHVGSEAFRLVTGLRGKLGEKFEWESALLYGRAETHDGEHNAVRESRLRLALTSSDPAKAFNPFGYTWKLVPQPGNPANPFLLQPDRPYTNPVALTDSLYDTFVRVGRTEMAGWDGKINGSLRDFSWLGGPIGVATGAEFRYENYRDWRPPWGGLNPPDAPFNGNQLDPDNLYFGRQENDFIGLSPNVNIYAARTIASVFAEVLVPIVGRRKSVPGMRALELTLAGRSERFSDFGRTAKPKIGAGWRPTDWILVRGSHSESFRAPNLVQTNPTALQRAVDGVTDPYRFAVTNLNVDTSASRTVFRQGNSGLRPEESKSLSVGTVLALPFHRDVTFTVDYWRIKQKDVIDDVTADAQLLRDQNLLQAAVQKQIESGRTIAQVDLGSGTASYAGNPQVRRFAVTPADMAIFNSYNTGKPASQQRAPVGGVQSIVTDYINLSGRDVEGMDFGFEWRNPKSRFGQISLRGDGSLLLKFDQQAEPGALITAGVNREGRPRVRGNLGATWRGGNWTAGWLATYYGAWVEEGAATTREVYEALGKPEYIAHFIDEGGVHRYDLIVRSSLTHNAYVNYAFKREGGRLWRGSSVRFGVNNVFDAEPPLADSTVGYQRGAGTNPRLRSFYAQLGKRF